MLKDKVKVEVRGFSGWMEVGEMADIIRVNGQKIILKEGDSIKVLADEDSE